MSVEFESTKEDYYKVLDCGRSSNPEDIRRQYRKLALKFHPHKNKEDGAQDTFYKVTEAFHVLSDANRRAVYDQYGFDGLKNGVPVREGYDGFPGKYHFHGDAEGVFQQFFGGDNPFADFFSEHSEHPVALFGSKFGGLYGMNNAANAEGPTQDSPVQKELGITLEEFYLGTVKKVKISRKILDDNGATTSQCDTVLTVDVQKGWKNGTKLIFPKEGDQGPNKIPADIVFTLKELEHPVFKRQGDDLIYTSNIPLVQALTNTVVTITTLDERILRIPINDVIHPTYSKEISNEGMPLASDPTKRGRLILKFNVVFPTGLTEEAKNAIKQAFNA